ncbi:hypothetical protein C8R44DRAFT_748359 [Mycena epipterygia]|nr:hypothetical protein C8R44DRAFT_748359 [Mycena epipterygia]
MPSSRSTLVVPSPGHRRCRIACSNCRKRKIKCIAGEKNKKNRLPCKRCSQQGCPCEYVSVSEEEASSPEPTTPENGPKWLQPLVPESYDRKQSSRPHMPAPKIFDGYTAPENFNYLDTGFIPFYDHVYSQQIPSYDPNSNGNMDGSPFDVWGNQDLPFTPTRVPSANIPYFPPMGGVHYGQFPGPANTIYPWTHRGSK